MRAAALLFCLIALAYAQQDASLGFIAFGDWGGQTGAPYTTPGERSLGQRLPAAIRANGTEFILAIGDNFYETGVTSVDDPRFEETFENVFAAPETQLPWYVVAGNHDHEGNTTAQVAYSKRSSRWYFPSLYYTFTKTVKSTRSSQSFTVQFIMIDTVNIDDGDPDQLAWIEAQLQQSVQNKVDWVFVAGHYPVWSVAEHGTTPSLQKSLKPLLDKYQVGAYFCGHDHNLQHIDTDETVGYFLTGAGHTAEYNQDHLATVPKGSLKFYWPYNDNPPVQSGYATVRVWTDHMQVDYLSSLGEQLYSVNWPNPRKAKLSASIKWLLKLVK